MRLCNKCKTEKPLSEFFLKNGKLTHYHCRQCNSDNVAERKREFKRQCVEYRGGVCIDCGFKGHQAVYDFHHLDPTQKDFQFGSIGTTKLNDVVKEELDKCVLLCSNCHRIRHATEQASFV